MSLNRVAVLISDDNSKLLSKKKAVYNEQLVLHLQERTSKDERDLRSLKKRLDKYASAKEAILDPFFTDLFVESDRMA